MTPKVEQVDYTPKPTQGRIYSHEHWNLLSDCDPTGRLRLDGLARILHDAATLDNESSPATEKGLWILRTLAIELDVWPQYLEPITTFTWCSGIGRAWAERRTNLSTDGKEIGRAKALWVNVAPDSGFPRSLPEGFLEIFGPSAEGRTVKPRFNLSLPEDTPSQQRGSIPLRYSDLDIVDHVNNAIHLALIEEVLAPAQRGTISPVAQFQRVTIEFHNGLQLPGPAEYSLWNRETSLFVHLHQNSTTASIIRLDHPLHQPQPRS